MALIAEKDIHSYLSSDLVLRYKVVPYEIDENSLTVLVDQNVYSDAVPGELELITGYDIKVLMSDPEIISQLISKHYRKDASTAKPVSKDAVVSDDLLVGIIKEARALKSSDIHIETYADRCRIRLRIDGKLLERYKLSREDYPSFINRIKIKARLDIAEKRLPQDGRILIGENGLDRMDIRVSVMPSLYGEKVVLRLLNNDSSAVTLESLGLDDKQLGDFKHVLQKPHGIILISGPTGSGKTTTLYATLKLLNKETSNILTVEDPIEYTLDGINQVQLKESIGLTFSSALRSFLRQDPDIIMLGEIRDGETAQMAIRAALTGHLVLSTIHTNSAWGIISRLTDMGVPGFLVSSTLNMTMAQRLVRKLCPKCKTASMADTDMSFAMPDLMQVPGRHFIPTGCNDCYYTGYAGRVAIYELIPIDSELSNFIQAGKSDISEYLKAMKIKSLKERAFELVMEGVTSLEEVYPILINS